MSFLHRPRRFAMTTPCVAKTLFPLRVEGSSNEPYIILSVNKKKSEFDTIAHDGSVQTLPFTAPFAEEGVNGFSGVWGGIKKAGKKIEVRFGNIKHTFSKGGMFAVHEEVIYRVIDCDRGNVVVSDGKKVKLLPLKNVRLFLSKDDAAEYIDFLLKSWDGYEEEAKKQGSILKHGFCKLDLKKLKELPIAKAYLESDAPNAFVGVTEGSMDFSLYIQNIGEVPLRYISEITDAEYREGVNLETKMKERRIVGQRILRGMEEELENFDDTIGVLQSRLVHRLRGRGKLIKKIQDRDIDNALDGFYEDLETIKKYKNIESARLEDLTLILVTKDVALTKLETSWIRTKDVPLPLSIGSFKIYIDILNSTISIATHIAPNYITGRHPHIGGSGTPCVGNMIDTVINAFAKMDIITIVDITMACLEQINDNGYQDRPVGDYINIDLIK